jgi:hypothetical protein
MIAFLDLIPRWVWMALVAALAATSCKLTVDLGSVKLELEKSKVAVAQMETAIARSNTEAANKTAALSNAVLKATNEAKTRETALRAAADAAATESDGLRADVENLRGQLSGATAAASAERAVAIAGVLSQCAARHQVLAERCDRHVNDVRTLIEAWPK